MRVLVTGGAGFIGRHVVEHFHEKAEVIALDNLRSGSQENLAGLRCQFMQGSILDRELVRQAMQGVDYVFHLAAMVSVPESIEKPDECAEFNTDGTRIVLEEAARAKARKLVFSSSAAIYGDSPIVPKVESMPAEPQSPYASTKLEGERLCQFFADEGLLATVSLRYFNVFGPHQAPKSQYAAAIPIFIEQAMDNQPIIVFGDGRQTRDFIYVRDVAAANAFFAIESSSTGAFNVACGGRTTILDLVSTIRALTNSSSEVIHIPERAGDIKHSVASVNKAQSAGYTPHWEFAEGLRRTIQFFRKPAAP